MAHALRASRLSGNHADLVIRECPDRLHVEIILEEPDRPDRVRYGIILNAEEWERMICLPFAERSDSDRSELPPADVSESLTFATERTRFTLSDSHSGDEIRLSMIDAQAEEYDEALFIILSREQWHYVCDLGFIDRQLTQRHAANPTAVTPASVH